MHTTTKVLLAFGLVTGAAALTLPTAGTAKAQGFYVDAPGVHVRVGHPHRRHYRRHYRPYETYGYAPGYYGAYPSYNGCPPHYTIQDGVCKPYRGY